MQGSFMQLLVLFLLESFRGLCPVTPTRGVAPWTPTGGLLQTPGPHFSADFSILNSHTCIIIIISADFLISQQCTHTQTSLLMFLLCMYIIMKNK